MRWLGTLAVSTCVATVISQAIGLTYLWCTGNFDRTSARRIVSILQGVDIVPANAGNRLAQDGGATPTSLDDFADLRMMRSLNFKLHDQAIQQGLRQLHTLQRSLKQEASVFDRRRTAFRQELEAKQSTARHNALAEVRRTIEAMEPALAKDQLVRMMNEGASNIVVTILRSMTLDIRKDILAEFRGYNDGELYEILRQMLRGAPEATMIDQTLDQLGHGIGRSQPAEVGANMAREAASQG